MVSFLEIFKLLKKDQIRVYQLNCFYLKSLRRSRLNKARDWKPYGLSFTDPWYTWGDTIEIGIQLEEIRNEFQKKQSKEEVWHR